MQARKLSSKALAMADQGRVEIWVERDIKAFHELLARRHWSNWIGRDILSRVIEICLEEVWTVDLAELLESPVDEGDARRFAAALISEVAIDIRAKLDPYAADYVRSQLWILRPWAVLERAICTRAVGVVLDDLAEFYEEIKRKS